MFPSTRHVKQITKFNKLLDLKEQLSIPYYRRSHSNTWICKFSMKAIYHEPSRTTSSQQHTAHLLKPTSSWFRSVSDLHEVLKMSFKQGQLRLNPIHTSWCLCTRNKQVIFPKFHLLSNCPKPTEVLTTVLHNRR